MFFRQIYDEALAQAAYLIGCQRTGEAIVIDPQRDIDRYLRLAHEQKLRIVAVAETHIHADFLSGTRELAEATGAKVLLSVHGEPEWSYQWQNKKQGGGAYDHQMLRDGDVFRIGMIEFQVMHTPGHTPEHICFVVTDRGSGAGEPMGIVTGDFVFVGDLGRPDLLETAAGVAGAKNASARDLFRSAAQVKCLPEYLQVWPGHGAGSACGKALGAVPQTTIGYELRFNPALLAATSEQNFVDYVLSGQPEPPLYFARMKQLNKDGPPLLGELPRPREWSVEDLKKLDAKEVAVLDTRPWNQFRAGHLPGALCTPMGNSLPTVAGSYVDPARPIVLIVDAPRVEHAVRLLVRVGVDRIESFATPATLDQCKTGDGKLETTSEIDIETFKRRMRDEDVFVVDVRGAGEYESGHIPGVPNIAHLRLAGRLDEIPRDRPVLVHCQMGGRSALATALLQSCGYDASNVVGGFLAYERSGGKVEREAIAAAAH